MIAPDQITRADVTHWWRHLAAGHSFEVAMAACPELAAEALQPTPTTTQTMAARCLIAHAINAAREEAHASACVRLDCALCRGPVFVPGDSRGEAVDCVSCGAQHVTRMDPDGVRLALVGPAPERTTP